MAIPVKFVSQVCASMRIRDRKFLFAEVECYLEWLGLVIMSVVLWFGIKAVRDEKPDRALTYGQGVRAGVTISLYAGLMGAVYTFIHFTFINTGFADYTIALTQEQWVAKGLTQAQMEGTEAFTRKILQPGVQAILGVFFAVVIGLVISLIISAPVKPKPQAAAS